MPAIALIKRAGMGTFVSLLCLGITGCGTSTSQSRSTVEAVSVTSNSPADPTPSTNATTTVVPAPISISAAFSGDILIHSQVWKAATVHAGGTGYDFTPMFSRIKPIIEAVDLAVCHLEVPLVSPGKRPTTNPLYSAPTELAAAIKFAGFDRCSTASNHSFDKGASGIDATLNEFDRLGLGHSGMARTPAEIAPRVIEINGAKVAHMSYTYGFNGIDAPNGEEWRSARIDPQRIIADAQAARTKGAQIVIVSMHWGREGQTKLSDFQNLNADLITKSGLIDLVIGHHAHVVQEIKQVNGVWTIFGLGNLISYLPTTPAFPAKTQDGMIVTVDLTLNPNGTVDVAKPKVIPTWVDKRRGVVVRPVLDDLADSSVPDEIKADLSVSLERTRSVVGGFIAPS